MGIARPSHGNPVEVGDVAVGARLALMVGLPRSGKSTYARALQESGWVRVEPDAFRRALHGQPFHGPAESLVWAAAELAVRALLLSRHAVVIDATNTTRRRRAQWLRMARELSVPAEALVTDAGLDECLARNGRSRRPVPEDVMQRMARQWEPPDAEAEGVAVRAVRTTSTKE